MLCFLYDLTWEQGAAGAGPGRSGGAAGPRPPSPAAAAASLCGGWTPSCQDSETRRPGTSSGRGADHSLHPAPLHCCPATRGERELFIYLFIPHMAVILKLNMYTYTGCFFYSAWWKGAGRRKSYFAGPFLKRNILSVTVTNTAT